MISPLHLHSCTQYETALPVQALVKTLSSVDDTLFTDVEIGTYIGRMQQTRLLDALFLSSFQSFPYFSRLFAGVSFVLPIQFHPLIVLLIFFGSRAGTFIIFLSYNATSTTRSANNIPIKKCENVNIQKVVLLRSLCVISYHGIQHLLSSEDSIVSHVFTI